MAMEAYELDPPPMPITDPAQLGLAIALSEARIMRAVQTGMAGLTTAIAQLAEDHHKSILEQERRNSSFATTLAVEQLTTRVVEMEGIKQLRNQQIADLTSATSKLADRMDYLEAARSSSLMTYLSYTLTGLFSAGCVVLSFILAHLK